VLKNIEDTEFKTKSLIGGLECNMGCDWSTLALMWHAEKNMKGINYIDTKAKCRHLKN
jgi:hypothetical protein